MKILDMKFKNVFREMLKITDNLAKQSRLSVYKSTLRDV